MKILFTGGGTGGHVFPIIAIAREIKRAYSKEDLQLIYIGPKDPFGEIFLSQEGIKIKSIFAGKIRRYFTPASAIQNFFDLLIKFPLGLLQAFIHIFFLAPDVIFSKGGYGSLPVVLVSWLLGTPTFLHESDLSPGLANKIASKFSLVIFTSFPKTGYFPVKKIILVGNPVREEMLRGSGEEAKKLFKLTGEKPVILIFGGSQGAQKINDLVLAILSDLLENFEIIHQVGESNFKQVLAEARVVVKKDKLRYYHLFPFLREKELINAYHISDLIISRAGSGSIFEIAALGKPSILVPLSTAAQNHQLKNAYFYGNVGACVVIEEANLTPHFFLERLKSLFSHPRQLEKMSNRAKKFSRPDTAKIIAKYLLDYLFG